MTSIQPIPPINLAQQATVRLKTEKLIQQARLDLDKKIEPIEVKFDLSGRSAGMYCSHYKQRWIRFNPYIFAKYFQQNIDTTIPHEVAHYLVDRLFGRRRVAAHGAEWQAMMKLLGSTPETTHNFDLSGIPIKKQQRHLYRCACQEHQLSSTRHNRVQSPKRQKYFCRCCKEELVFIAA